MDLQALIAEGFYDPDAANADDLDDFRMLKEPTRSSAGPGEFEAISARAGVNAVTFAHHSIR